MLKELIYKQALKLNRLEHKTLESPFMFHASEAGECSRRIWFKKQNRPYERKEDDENNQARVQILLRGGRYIQELITDLIKQAPGVHITNIEDDRLLECVSPKGKSFCVLAHSDGLLYFTKSKDYYVLEVKGISTFSCKNKGWELSDGDIETLKKAYASAIPQGRMYARAFSKSANGIKIKGIIIIVFDKNNSTLYEFLIPIDEKSTDRIIKKFGNIVDGVEPPCDYLKNDSKCNFCPWPTECGHGR